MSKKIVTVKKRNFDRYISKLSGSLKDISSFINNAEKEQIEKGLILVYSPEYLLYDEGEPAMLILFKNGDCGIIVGDIYTTLDNITKKFLILHEVGHYKANDISRGSRRTPVQEFAADLYASRILGFDVAILSAKKIKKAIKKYNALDKTISINDSYNELDIRIQMLKYCKKSDYDRIEDFII